MIRLLLLAALLAASACTPARVVGNAAITGGQVVLGAADMVI
ncbi:hypothetical protein AB3Y40_07965 [Yoonia sp. R2331]